MAFGSKHIAPTSLAPTLRLLLLCLYVSLLLPSHKSLAQVGFEMVENKKTVRIPFEMHRNLILVKANINNKGPYTFLLDTGVSNSIITDPSLKDSLNLVQGRNIFLVGAGEGNNLQAFITYGLDITMPGVRAKSHSLAVLSEDILKLSSYVGVPVHGILGYDFFCNMVVDINFRSQYISLYQPKRYRYKGKGIAIPIYLEEKRPYVYAHSEISDSVKIPVKLIIDTGAGHALSLETGTHEAIVITQPALRTQLGVGLNGTLKGYMGRTKSFTLGNFQLENIITSFPDFEMVAAKKKIFRHGNLGIDLLRKFNIVFDYSRQVMYISPNKYYKESFEHDMCGVELIAQGNDFRKYIIYHVYPNSPAEAAGLMVGDELIAIDTKMTKDMEITAISRLLRSKHGRKINLVLSRNNKFVLTTVTLQRQI